MPDSMGVLKRDCVYHATRRPKITSGFKRIWRRNPRKSVRKIQPGSRWNVASPMKLEPNSSSHPAKTIIFEITRCMSTYWLPVISICGGRDWKAVRTTRVLRRYTHLDHSFEHSDSSLILCLIVLSLKNMSDATRFRTRG